MLEGKRLEEALRERGNAFLLETGRTDDMYMPMDDFDDEFASCTAHDVALKCFNGYAWGTDRREAFNPNAPYFFLNGYANCVSLYECEVLGYLKTVVDADEFAEWYAKEYGDE